MARMLQIDLESTRLTEPAAQVNAGLRQTTHLCMLVMMC